MANESVEDEPERVSDAMRAARPPRPSGVARSVGLANVLGAVTESAPAPTQVDRFLIEEKLGEGGMGVVFRAHDPTLDRPVAIKVMRETWGETEQGRILGEAKALARLSHPEVVAVYDVGLADGQIFVAMEYVPGVTLTAWLEEHPSASVEEVVGMFLKAGRGLAAAHAAGIVHRDFKPDNVLVGEDGRVRVVDFGLARFAVDAELDAGDLPGTRRKSGLAGTRSFMAPEVKEGTRAGPRSDQFSFCVALWRALDPDSAPATISTRIPTALDQILRQGLSPDPTQRWGSVEDLLEALERAVASRPADRLRSVLLNRVERLWIQGVLRASVDQEEPMELPIHAVHALVASPTTKSEDEDPLTTADLREVYESSHCALLVLGAPGAGKTTAILELTRRLIDEARRDVSQPAPVVLNLANFGRFKGGLAEWVESELVTKYSLARRRSRSWLEEDRLVLVLDGLDEVPEARRRSCVERINAFRREHPVATLVGCREGVYDRIGLRLSVGGAVRIEAPGPRQIRAFLERFGDRGREVADVLERDASLRQEATSPLILRMLALAGPTAERGADLRAALYERYLDYVFEHDKTARVESREQVLAGLRWLARVMERRGETELWLERIQASWFEHAWQKYVGIGLGLVLIWGLMYGLNLAAAVVVGRPLSTGIVLAFGGLAVILVFARGVRVRPVERLTWSWKRSLKGAPITLALALPIMYLYGLTYDTVMENLLAGVFGAVLAAVAFGLEGAERESRVRPNAGIRQSLRNGLALGATGVVVTAATFAGLFMPFLGWLNETYQLDRPSLETADATIPAAIFLGSMILFIYGGAAVAFHAALRLCLVAWSPLPADLVGFLNRASDRALLRRVGGGYIFVHRTLRDHLAGHEETVEAT